MFEILKNPIQSEKASEGHARGPDSRQGFTLPEVVITSFLILLMMLPLSRLAFSSVSSTRYARDMGSAVAIGQQKLEAFSKMEYADIVNGNEVVDGYVLTWSVTEDSEIKLVRLQIAWRILGRELDLNLNTVYSSEKDAGFSF
ncbi:MAG: prepilin-type N-terminal cleavage/methylation domain-containing protein [Verrucomicrobia bacterium]|nr:prepilin-type N-terminal cleavage/methylation domain-containing protein [Verrucomicrobiota bacterium]MCH8514612.1 prepilin-type N-terminal cleavage/methylation domain-containing protein [Kiritimatiellia bacterium]